MDGGNGLNLMYLDTFEGLGLVRDQLKNSLHPFYGVVPGKLFAPLGQITLPITFGDATNYCIEMLTIEVVDFSGSYHVILGWPSYVKFIAIPSYAYLKLKISGPADIIIVEAKAQWALDYEQSSIELSATAVTIVEIKELCLRASLTSVGLAILSTHGSFKAIKDVKVMQIDVEDPTKTVQIWAVLSPK
jgi:hypothetical protein